MYHQVISILKQFGKPNDCCSQNNSASQMIVVLKKRITKIKGRPEGIKFNLILSFDYGRVKCYEAS